MSREDESTVVSVLDALMVLVIVFAAVSFMWNGGNFEKIVVMELAAIAVLLLSE